MSSDETALDRAIAGLQLLRQQASGLNDSPPGTLAADPAFLDQLLNDVQSQRTTLVRFARLKQFSDLAQEAGAVGAYEFNVRTGQLNWSASVRALYEMDDISAPSLQQWMAAIHPEDRDSVMATAQRAIQHGEPVHQVYRIQLPSGHVKWLEDRGRVVLAPDGAPERVVGLNIDITRLREAQQQREFLMQELGHRVKNIIAMIQAMAYRTLRADKVDPSIRQDFENRLFAISRAHDILIQQDWKTGSVAEIAHAVLEHYRGRDNRIRMSGPHVDLGPQATVAVSMVLHELCTNAVKYGSLSNAEGRVELSWSVERPAGAALLRLSWQETGGPPVAMPIREGFGAGMIRQSFSFDPNAKVEIAFEPPGVRCTILASVQQPALTAEPLSA